MTSRPRQIIQGELAEARGDLSRLQRSGEASSANARAALERVIALQQELDSLDEEEGDHEQTSGDNE
jgi:hypothetical protein